MGWRPQTLAKGTLTPPRKRQKIDRYVIPDYLLRFWRRKNRLLAQFLPLLLTLSEQNV